MAKISVAEVVASHKLRKIFELIRDLSRPSKQDFFAWVNYLRFLGYHNPYEVNKYKDLHKGATVYVLGSGPSLSEEDLSLLEDAVVVAYNASYQALEGVRPAAFYSCIGGIRMNQLSGVDRSYFDASFRFLGAYRSEILNSDAIKKEDIFLRIPVRVILYKVKEAGSGFSDDLSNYVLNGGAGTGIFTAIQIAAYMGASKIVLLGADFSASSEKSHFAYFGQPDRETAESVAALYRSRYEKRIRPTLKRYQAHLRSRGIELINASKKTSDDVLQKVSLSELARKDA